MSCVTADLFFGELSELLNVKEFARAASLCEKREAEGSIAATPMFYNLMAVCYMLSGQLVDARFALKRAGDYGFSLIECHRILSALWHDDYPRAYAASNVNIGVPAATASLRDCIAIWMYRRYLRAAPSSDVVNVGDVSLRLGCTEALLRRLIEEHGGDEGLLASRGGCSAAHSTDADKVRMISSSATTVNGPC